MDDKKKALLLNQKASEATKRYATADETAQKIWYARYENEYPDRTEKSVEEKNKRIEELEAELGNVTTYNDKMSEHHDLHVVENENLQKGVNGWMWGGIGIGVAGLAMLGAGAGVIATNNDNPVEVNFRLDDFGRSI